MESYNKRYAESRGVTEEQFLDLLAMGKAMTTERRDDKMNRPDDLVVTEKAREARFAELNVLNKGQMARILRIQQEGGRSFPKPSTYMKKTKAELIWLLVDAELPMVRDSAGEKPPPTEGGNDVMARGQEDRTTAIEREEIAAMLAETEEAKELEEARAAIAKQREALQAMFDPMFETAAKPNKRRKRRARQPKHAPIKAEHMPTSGPDREPATEADFLAAREKVVWKDGRVPTGKYIGGKRGCTTWPWSYLAKYYEDPVAWARCKCLRLELDSVTPWRFYTEGENVVFAPCLSPKEVAPNLKIYDPEVWKKAAAILEEAARS